MSVYNNHHSNDAEEKFNSFLNKTIIMSSKRYLKKESNISRKEHYSMDNEDFTAFLQDFIAPNSSCYDDVENTLQLNKAISTLSVVEQAVIFLLFNEDLSQEDAGKILEICSKSVSRIKLRALNKLRKYMEGDLK
jgi:RNA polymerase sigma factor (sigma-70 family)